MMIRPILLAAAAIAPAAAVAAGPLEVRSKVLVEARERAPDGTTRVNLVPAAKVVPGDRIVYVITYSNTGTRPISDLVLADPLPHGLVYRAPAAGSPAPELSVDGRTFGALGDLRVGGAGRPAAAADVTHVRWRLTQALPPGAKGQVAFQAVLK